MEFIMYNLGRGMWRRVGDYERGQNSSIKMYNDMMVERKMQIIQRQIAINAYRQEMLKKINAPQFNTTLEPMQMEVQKDDIIIEKSPISNREDSEIDSVIENEMTSTNETIAIANESISNESISNESIASETIFHQVDTLETETKNKKRKKNKNKQ